MWPLSRNDSIKPITAHLPRYLYHAIFFPSIYFADKSIAITSLSKCETLDSKAARLDGNKLAKTDFTLKLYKGFINR